jgi:hypothetical protein
VFLYDFTTLVDGYHNRTNITLILNSPFNQCYCTDNSQISTDQVHILHSIETKEFLVPFIKLPFQRVGCWPGLLAQVIKVLPSKHGVLSSNPNTIKKTSYYLQHYKSKGLQSHPNMHQKMVITGDSVKS